MLLRFWTRVQCHRLARWFSEGSVHIPNDVAIKLLAFTGAASAVIAQAEAVPDIFRYAAAALAAGCAAVLSLSRAPGQQRPPEDRR